MTKILKKLKAWLQNEDKTNGIVFLNSEVPLSPAFKTCFCCNEGDLCWGKLEDKWRLYNEDGTLHICPVNPLVLTDGRRLSNDTRPDDEQ